jgi:hypothetical protein
MNSEARVLMELMSDSDSEDNLEGLMPSGNNIVLHYFRCLEFCRQTAKCSTHILKTAINGKINASGKNVPSCVQTDNKAFCLQAAVVLTINMNNKCARS